MIQNKRIFPGELAMVLGLILNSFGLSLMIKSDWGTSPISSLPLVLSQLFPFITLGTFTYIVQTLVILLLILSTRIFKPGYLVSVALAVAFGYMVDFSTFVLSFFPNGLLLDAFYFALSMIMMSAGIGLLVRCRVPVLPFDTFTRDFSAHFSLSVKRVKTCFDLTCLILSLLLAAVGLHTVWGIGIGVGTIISSLFTGLLVGAVCRYYGQLFHFEPHWDALGKLS
ncbi:MAG: DUF6198 family protein [Eubacteriales bacterium]|jgi:uncharacterized membrane protein YczE